MLSFESLCLGFSLWLSVLALLFEVIVLVWVLNILVLTTSLCVNQFFLVCSQKQSGTYLWIVLFAAEYLLF